MDHKARHWKQAALRRAILPLLLMVAGIAIAVAASDLVGWTVFAVGTVLLIALAFLEVGYSEDRARGDDRNP